MRLILAAALSFALASEGLAYTVTVNAYANPFGFPSSDDKSEFFGATALEAFVGCRIPPDPMTLCERTEAQAFADMATTELAVYVDVGGVNDARAARAGAMLSENLMFSLPSGVSSMPLTMSMTVHGDTTAVPGGTGSWSIGALLDFGGQGTFLILPVDVGGPFNETGSVTATVYDGVPIAITFVLNAEVDNLSLQPGVFIDGPIIIDALHTASLSISLPAGVTFQSESGVFLTQVSEPSVLQLLLLAVPGIAAASRFRR